MPAVGEVENEEARFALNASTPPPVRGEGRPCRMSSPLGSGEVGPFAAGPQGKWSVPVRIGEGGAEVSMPPPARARFAARAAEGGRVNERFE